MSVPQEKADTAAPSACGVAEEDGVRFVVAAFDGDFCAVFGKVELVDSFGREMGELVRSGTIERLHPEVADAFLVDGIDNGLAVRSKL